MLREKVVASLSKRFVVIVDESKISPILGANFALPVEVVPFAIPVVTQQIQALIPGSVIRRRPSPNPTADAPHYRTVNELTILDVDVRPAGFVTTASPAQLDALGNALATIPGVASHGFFVGMATDVIVGGGPDLVRTLPAPLLTLSSGPSAASPSA